jgi:hypothetical protein
VALRDYWTVFLDAKGKDSTIVISLARQFLETVKLGDEKATGMHGRIEHVMFIHVKRLKRVLEGKPRN